MADGIFTALSGAMAQMQALESLSNDLSNTGTVGFKGTHTVFSDVLAAVQSTPNAIPTSVHVKIADQQNDFSQGILRTTDNPMDVSLTGPGFFVVNSPSGEKLTRQGAFMLRGDGSMQTHEGLPVVGISGNTVRVPLATQVRIDSYGTVFANEVAIDRLRVVMPPDVDKLRRETHGTWGFPKDAVLEPVDTVLEPGTLETANVSPVHLMTEMIGIQRAYESYHRSIETIRSMEQKLTNEVS